MYSDLDHLEDNEIAKDKDIMVSSLYYPKDDISITTIQDITPITDHDRDVNFASLKTIAYANAA